MEIELQIGGEKIRERKVLEVDVDETGEAEKDRELRRDVVLGSINEADIFRELEFYAQNPGEFDGRYGKLLKVEDEKTQETPFNLERIHERLRTRGFKIPGEDENEFIGRDGKPQWHRLVYIASGGDDGEFADILQNNERYKVGNLTKTGDKRYFILVKDKTENREKRVEIDEGIFRMDAGLEYLMQFAKGEIIPEENRKKDLLSIFKRSLFEGDFINGLNKSFISSLKKRSSFDDYLGFNYRNRVIVNKKDIKMIVDEHKYIETEYLSLNF